LNDNEQQNFFDVRTIAAVLLVGLTFVGWQWYMQKKYPQAVSGKKPAVTKTEAAAPGAPAAAKTETAAVKPAAAAPVAAGPEKLVGYASENLAFDISSHGMGLKNIKVLKYKDHAGKPIELGHPEPTALALETRLLGRADVLHFAVEKINANMFVGRASAGPLKIAKTMEIDPEKYLITYKVQVSGADPQFVGLTTFLTERIEPPPNQSMLSFMLPAVAMQEFFVETAKDDERIIFHQKDEQHSWTQVKLASIGSRYFTQAVMDKSDVMPEAKAFIDNKTQHTEIALQYSVLNKGADFNLNYQAYVGPKTHEMLSNVDATLAKVVDFGFFNRIGRLILQLLQWFHGLVGNWGWAIILLTLLVRMCLLPLNIYSFKSMKAMQVIQPKMQALREKYKDDPAQQQQAIMGLMKEHKVNPLAGCLPVFLQLPIFIALYQVLGNSIELYQAPFALWIHDLSLMDPFYILPVLMGVTMFVQMKITPSTMDPAQAKVMMIMPLVFMVFMVELPSGLTLYMWVSALFSVLQQMYFMRDGRKT